MLLSCVAPKEVLLPASAMNFPQPLLKLCSSKGTSQLPGAKATQTLHNTHLVCIWKIVCHYMSLILVLQRTSVLQL